MKISILGPTLAALAALAVLAPLGACDPEPAGPRSIDEHELAARLWEDIEGYRDWSSFESAAGQIIYNESEDIDVHTAPPGSIFVVEPALPGDVVHAMIRLSEPEGYLWAEYEADGSVADSALVVAEPDDTRFRLGKKTAGEGSLECVACHLGSIGVIPG